MGGYLLAWMPWPVTSSGWWFFIFQMGSDKLKAFLLSLGHAALNAVVTACATQAVGVTGFKQLGLIAGSSAIGGVVSYLTKAPLVSWLHTAQ